MHSRADPGGSRFVTTHWSVVLAAGQSATARSQAALARLCETYWYPLYAYVRRRGHTSDESQDLTQEFFARFLEKNYLQSVQRDSGRFRSFLLAALNHFLANEWDRARAAKRGGGSRLFSLDFRGAEGRYSHEPSDPATPEKIFERRWTLTVLETVLARLREEYARGGKERLFDRLKESLAGEKGESYSQAAAELGMSEGAVKTAVHRLRRRYRQLLRDEISQTVAEEGQIEDEINFLFSALRS